MKYIIELEDTPFNGLYKAKGFNTLVFDANGLKKLKTAQEEFAQQHGAGYALGLKEGRQSLTESSSGSYNKALNDAWDLAKKVVLCESDGGMSVVDMCKAFDDCSYSSEHILKKFSGVEAWSAYNKYRKANELMETIKVGTVVRTTCGLDAVGNKLLDVGTIATITDIDLSDKLPYKLTDTLYNESYWYDTDMFEVLPFQVGDEVIANDHRQIVTAYVTDTLIFTVNEHGQTGHFDMDELEPTGRHFDEMGELIKKMNTRGRTSEMS